MVGLDYKASTMLVDILEWLKLTVSWLKHTLLSLGLLYYAGHGYENYGNSFMVPVDAPNPYRSANCLCVQSILKLMQEKETGLNVFLLDMCRKRWVLEANTITFVKSDNWYLFTERFNMHVSERPQMLFLILQIIFVCLFVLVDIFTFSGSLEFWGKNSAHTPLMPAVKGRSQANLAFFLNGHKPKRLLIITIINKQWKAPINITMNPNSDVLLQYKSLLEPFYIRDLNITYVPMV